MCVSSCSSRLWLTRIPTANAPHFPPGFIRHSRSLHSLRALTNRIVFWPTLGRTSSSFRRRREASDEDRPPSYEESEAAVFLAIANRAAIDELEAAERRLVSRRRNGFEVQGRNVRTGSLSARVPRVA